MPNNIFGEFSLLLIIKFKQKRITKINILSGNDNNVATPVKLNCYWNHMTIIQYNDKSHSLRLYGSYF